MSQYIGKTWSSPELATERDTASRVILIARACPKPAIARCIDICPKTLTFFFCKSLWACFTHLRSTFLLCFFHMCTSLFRMSTIFQLSANSLLFMERSLSSSPIVSRKKSASIGSTIRLQGIATATSTVNGFLWARFLAMFFLMAVSTKGDTIGYFEAQFGKVIPFLNVMRIQEVAMSVLIAATLAGKVIAFKDGYLPRIVMRVAIPIEFGSATLPIPVLFATLSFTDFLFSLFRHFLASLSTRISLTLFLSSFLPFIRLRKISTVFRGFNITLHTARNGSTMFRSKGLALASGIFRGYSIHRLASNQVSLTPGGASNTAQAKRYLPPDYTTQSRLPSSFMKLLLHSLALEIKAINEKQSEILEALQPKKRGVKP